jgi:protein-export membrane protein SecD
MHTLLAVVSSIAQAAGAAGPAVEWWRESWFSWLLTIATVAVPTFISWVLAKQLRVGDMWARLAAVLVASAAGAVVVALGWPPRLGIDLKGGVILVYEIDRSKQVADRVDECVGRVQQLVARREGASVTRTANGRIAVRPGTTDAAARQTLVEEIGGLDLGDTSLVPVSGRGAGDELLFEVRGQTDPIDMDKLVAAVSRRVNPGGQKEVTVRRFGLDQIEVIVPEVDQAEVDLIKRIVSSAGVLEFRITANEFDSKHADVIERSRTPGTTVINGSGGQVGRWIRLDTAQLDPQGLVTRPGPDGTTEVLVVLDTFNVNGGYLVRAMSSLDQSLQPCVNFAFNTAGSTLFGALTGNNLPDPANGLERRLGIVLDDVLLSAPRIREAISGNGQITGDFKKSDIDFLVGILNAGSLPAALVSEPISEQKISPQLGADTIRSGAWAMVVATALVLLFMLVYYRFAGLVADLAVLLNILLVVAVMISIKAAFTLAGLAGLVLSVGMAVDANVLIYERMREEQERGASLRTAIRNGFQRAFSTIVDSNLTTLITGLVLFAIGTDQLKGFAVTLILGLTLNLFTAVFCARVMFDLAERCRWIKRLSMARVFGETNFPFVAWMRPAVIGSAAFILLGLLAAWQRGQGLFDIDFTGGTSVQVAFKPGQELDVASVRQKVSALPDVAVSAISGADIAPGSRYKIDTSLRSAGEGEGEVEKTLHLFDAVRADRQPAAGRRRYSGRAPHHRAAHVPRTDQPADPRGDARGCTGGRRVGGCRVHAGVARPDEPHQARQRLDARHRPRRRYHPQGARPCGGQTRRHPGVSLRQQHRRQGRRQHEGHRRLCPAGEPPDDRALRLAKVPECGLRCRGRRGARPRRAGGDRLPGDQPVRVAVSRLGPGGRLQDQPRRGRGPADDRRFLDQRHDRDLRPDPGTPRQAAIRLRRHGRQGRQSDPQPHDPHLRYGPRGDADPLPVRWAGDPCVRVHDARRHHHRYLQHGVHRLADRALAAGAVRGVPQPRRYADGGPGRLIRSRAPIGADVFAAGPSSFSGRGHS